MDVFERFAEAYGRDKQEEMSLQEYLLGCRENPIYYASAAERMIMAVGEPEQAKVGTDLSARK